MLCDLLHVDAFSLFYSKLLFAKLSLFLFSLILPNCIDNLLAYVAALFMTSICRLLSLRGWGDSAWDSKSFDFFYCSRSHIRILHVVEFLLIWGLFLLFLISIDRAAFWSCSRKCLRSAASPLCSNNENIFFYKQATFFVQISSLNFAASFWAVKSDDRKKWELIPSIKNLELTFVS